MQAAGNAAVEMREIRGDGTALLQAAPCEGKESSTIWDNPEAGKIYEGLMTSIELSIDLMPDDRETLERRLSLVEKNLEKRVRYEGGRLR